MLHWVRANWLVEKNRRANQSALKMKHNVNKGRNVLYRIGPAFSSKRMLALGSINQHQLIYFCCWKAASFAKEIIFTPRIAQKQVFATIWFVSFAFDALGLIQWTFVNKVKIAIYTFKGKSYSFMETTELGCGDGLMVRVHTFCLDDPRLNAPKHNLHLFM